MVFDPNSTGDVDPNTARIQKKLKTATGGMKTVLENQLRDQQIHEQRVNERDAMMDKIQADTERLRKSALATWNKEKTAEENK